MLRWLQTYVRGKKLTEIDRALIDRLAREKKKNGVTPATVNRMLTLVRSILRKCVEWDWIDSAPVIRLLSEPKEESGGLRRKRLKGS